MGCLLISILYFISSLFFLQVRQFISIPAVPIVSRYRIMLEKSYSPDKSATKLTRGLDCELGYYIPWLFWLEQLAFITQVSESLRVSLTHLCCMDVLDVLLHLCVDHARSQGNAGNIRLFRRQSSCYVVDAGFGRSVSAPGRIERNGSAGGCEDYGTSTFT